MERIDEIRQRMVAALYDELPAEELKTLRAQIAASGELSREWDELQGARAFLRQAESEESAPQFVFLGPEPAAPRAARVRPGRAAGGWLERWLAGLRTPVTGFALATGALIVLLAAGLRVDRTPAGLIVHFGGSAPVLTAQGPGVPGGPLAGVPGSESAGVPLEPGIRSASPGGALADGAAAAGRAPYLTRSEFAAYANQLAASLEQGLDDYALRGRGETVVMLREVYDQIERSQQRDREAIRAQINDMWLQLVRAGEGADGGAPAVPGAEPGDGAQPLEPRPAKDTQSGR